MKKEKTKKNLKDSIIESQKQNIERLKRNCDTYERWYELESEENSKYNCAMGIMVELLHTDKLRDALDELYDFREDKKFEEECNGGTNGKD